MGAAGPRFKAAALLEKPRFHGRLALALAMRNAPGRGGAPDRISLRRQSEEAVNGERPAACGALDGAHARLQGTAAVSLRDDRASNVWVRMAPGFCLIVSASTVSISETSPKRNFKRYDHSPVM